MTTTTKTMCPRTSEKHSKTSEKTIENICKNARTRPKSRYGPEPFRVKSRYGSKITQITLTNRQSDNVRPEHAWHTFGICSNKFAEGKARSLVARHDYRGEGMVRRQARSPEQGMVRGKARSSGAVAAVTAIGGITTLGVSPLRRASNSDRFAGQCPSTPEKHR